MQRRFSLFTLLILLAFGGVSQVSAKDGYRFTVKFTDVKDSLVYLAHYYGKPLPTIYKSDSARFDKNGVATFESKEKIVGGIYMMLLSDRKTYYEFLLNNGDEFSMVATAKELPEGVKFKGSPANDEFLGYIKFLKGFSKQQQNYLEDVSKAKTAADTIAVQKKYTEIGKSLTNFRRDYMVAHPGSLLSNIFGAMAQPEVPENIQTKPDGTSDSMATYLYFKQHYWDGFNFEDDRLIHTPVFDGKLEEYFNKLVFPVEDSMNKEADWLLAKVRGSKELFKYSLWWLTRNAESSKIMGMDAVFVYLVENYYMKGDAYWMDAETLEKYVDRAHKIAPNVIGNIAPEIVLPDNKGKLHSLKDLKAKYTLLVFWSPDCGHCMKEIPQVDSLYRAVLKDKGVKVYAVRTEGEEKKWQEAIEKNKISDWVHVWDPEHKSRFRADYDIYSTPVLYLLDEDKIIRGKRLDHTNLPGLIEMLDKKKAADKLKAKSK
jgi:peroxiredoxin